MNLLKLFITLGFIVFSQLVIADIGIATNIASPNLEYLNNIDSKFAVKKAMYREILSLAYERIITKVRLQSLQPNSWGVIFALDGTLLDSKTLLPNPGVDVITCKIKNNGGRVVIVSQRYNPNLQDNKYIENTVNLIKSSGICFDSIVFANNQKDTDKNPKFTAVSSGDYENITTSKILSGFNVIAYFGSKITDFPNLKENLAEKLPLNDNMYKDFGQQYFMLPR